MLRLEIVKRGKRVRSYRNCFGFKYLIFAFIIVEETVVLFPFQSSIYYDCKIP